MPGECAADGPRFRWTFEVPESHGCVAAGRGEEPFAVCERQIVDVAGVPGVEVSEEFGSVRVLTSQKVTVVSPFSVARTRPSGLNATCPPYRVASAMGGPNGSGRIGVVTFQSRTVWSPLAVARMRPSGLSARLLT